MAEASTRQSVLADLAKRGWVSLRQFTDLAGISYPTAQRLRDKGYLRTVQVGGIFRVYADEVERYLTHGNYKPEEEGASAPSNS